MESLEKPVIYTIGHSTRPLEEFLKMLKSFNIEVLADVRRFAGSKRYPWFSKENLEKVLPENNIEYIHFGALGGRRKVQPDSVNSRWRNESFRGYADYMETEEFTKAIGKLETIARTKTTAFMCSEAVWWSCHRSMISDYLKAKGWDVEHIMNIEKTEEHPYTAPARISNGKVFYSDASLFD
ncbi:DUF488 family protein [Chryseobacterium sp. BIGb0232]|uniref:DUF488 domain-containing protein n=1 Tax=Chryseobacterium sp. BIGb0232 TaxID=2940598 RepID=UPI000F485B7F|nr:DUF488 domain-containing protein [Chryseobacterium sp. BIGb0232]MCS4304034.1 uncharacterized protein (DUF488 family) [Chryseobacterium sp. BIGb0232]ROS17617.1 uncharacterized protein DUF488 [Chryseobacterium nakagawai]